MHGHDFVILKTGYPEYNKTSSLWDTPNSDLECPDKKMCRKMNDDKELLLAPAHSRPLCAFQDHQQTTSGDAEFLDLKGH